MLTTYHFLFTAEIVSPMELDDHSGSALRGSLFDAIWRRFCTNKEAWTCAECSLHTVCPVSALVAPLRDEHTHGRDIPRPYILLPPLGEARRYERGSTFQFGMTLFGSIIQFLPYLVLSVQQMEANGLGKRVVSNGGQRGRFVITSIEAYHPFTGVKQYLYRQGSLLMQTPAISVGRPEVLERTSGISQHRITLEFLTPMRLIDQGQLIERLSFRSLIHRLQDRLSALDQTYGESQPPSESGEEEAPDVIKLSKEVVCVHDDTYWEEVKSFSRRQGRTTPISGLRGKITFEGQLEPFAELLIWGELIHVGKSVVKGNGWYRMISEE